MDYEKKYKEALERAKEKYTKCYSPTLLDYIFPELKENKDIEIKKDIIRSLKIYIKCIKDGYDAPSAKDFVVKEIEKQIAWLEKQESCYSFEIKKGHWYKCVCDYMLNNSDLMFKNDRLYYCRSDWRLRGEIDERNVKNIGVNGYKSFFRPATNQEIKEWLEKQGDKDSQVKLPTFIFDDILALQCCMETVKKVQNDKDLYEKLNDLHGRIYDTYYLEKQGEQNPYSGVSFKYNSHTWGMCARDGGVEILVDGEIKERVFLDNKPQDKYAQEATKEEKVDNQNCVKSVDDIKPKFKVGDWISNDMCDAHIASIEDGMYYFDEGDGLSIVFVDEHYHLWTIEDAMDGDVLFHSDSASNGIFIFKEIIDKGFAKEVICYCDYDSEDHFCLGEHHTCCWTDAKILYPATKEQRDLLFQKMKEAGYTFDFKNKELKRLSQSEVTKIIGE